MNFDDMRELITRPEPDNPGDAPPPAGWGVRTFWVAVSAMVVLVLLLFWRMRLFSRL